MYRRSCITPHPPPQPTHCVAVEHHAGDTFTKTFEIKGIRNTSDKERSTYDFTCRLVNQRGKVCMECDRTTMFPFFAPPSPRDSTATPEEQPPPKPADRLRDHVVKQSEKLGELACGWVLVRLPPFVCAARVAAREYVVQQCGPAHKKHLLLSAAILCEAQTLLCPHH